MKSAFQTALLAAGSLVVATAAQAATTVINFDEFPATNNNSPLTSAYAGVGVSFGGDNAGTWAGLGGGDPGNWLIAGTNGSQFLGFNGVGPTGGYSDTLSFMTALTGVSFDVSRSNGSSNGTITLDAYDGAVLVASTTAILGALNTWSTLSVTGAGITSIVITGTGSGYHPFGVDNLVMTTDAIPEISTWAMMGAGFVGLAFAGWSRKRRPAAAIA